MGWQRAPFVVPLLFGRHPPSPQPIHHGVTMAMSDTGLSNRTPKLGN